MLYRILLVVIMIHAIVTEAAAEDLFAKYSDVGKTIDSIAIPTSPAFAVLGVTPDKVTRPGNSRELALALLQGVDEKGNFQNGLAVDSSWYLMLFGNDLELYQYRTDNVKRFLSRMNLSIGTSKGASESDKSEKLAVGIRQVIFDFGDPRLDEVLTACINKAHQDVLDHYPPIPLNVLTDPTKEEEKLLAFREREKAAEDKVKLCRDASTKRNFAKSAMDFGISPIWISEDGQTKNMAWKGITTWTSLQINVQDVLAIANVRYKTKDSQNDPGAAGQFLEGDSISAGLKLRYGSQSSGLLAQGVYTSFNPSVGKRDDQFLYSVGGEIKIAENLWLQAYVGGTSTKEKSDNGFVTSQLKWAFSETSGLKK